MKDDLYVDPVNLAQLGWQHHGWVPFLQLLFLSQFSFV